MSRTANLRRQHDGASLLAEQIATLTAQIGGRPSSAEAFQLTMLIARLTGALRIHFAQEDQHLYPSLMASGQGGTAATARLFFEEMGKIGPAIASFGEKWLSSDRIIEDWDSFRSESAGLFAKLADRIHRENEILYPLADELASSEGQIRAA